MFTWLGVKSRSDIKKTMCAPKKDWTTCSEFVHHLEHNNELDWEGGDLYDHLITHIISHLTMNMIFIGAPKSMRNVTMDTIWIC